MATSLGDSAGPEVGNKGGRGGLGGRGAFSGSRVGQVGPARVRSIESSFRMSLAMPEPSSRLQARHTFGRDFSLAKAGGLASCKGVGFFTCWCIAGDRRPYCSVVLQCLEIEIFLL
jgi:hypothetical protein